MRRREFAKVIAGSALAWPLRAHGQQRVPTVGVLTVASESALVVRLEAIRQGLAREGYKEGQNVAIETQFAGDHPERLPELANLVRRHVDVIVVAGGTNTALAAKAATTTIPIVFSI